jgi:hypothetical protein
MSFLKKHKGKIIIAVAALAVLVAAFFLEGNSSKQNGIGTEDERYVSSSTGNTSSAEDAESGYLNRDGNSEDENNDENGEETADEINTDSEQENNEDALTYSEENGMVIDSSTGKDKYGTEPVQKGEPLPVEPQDSVVTDEELTCTLSVRCDTVLNNLSSLNKEKSELIPKDGVIFPEQTVTFYDGESVFNLLLREMKKNKIHMEFENTPIYNSAYIEGINNLYEYDCGELSGWMYKVNGSFPNYGCSRYRLKQGDKVEFVYTCDLGRDVGSDGAEEQNKKQ